MNAGRGPGAGDRQGNVLLANFFPIRSETGFAHGVGSFAVDTPGSTVQVHAECQGSMLLAPPRPPAPGPRPRSCRGYTLIEVIVAFAILALGLTLLLGTLTGATRQVRWADEAGRAALHAQSLLDDTGVGVALQPGQASGAFEDGHYRWSMVVTPYRDPLLPPVQSRDLGAPRLLQLSLTVQWGDGNDARRRLHLQTLRLVTPNPLATGGSR